MLACEHTFAGALRRHARKKAPLHTLPRPGASTPSVLPKATSQRSAVSGPAEKDLRSGAYDRRMVVGA